ncbi:hypothetical protein JIX56_16615 [Streptomyces sp. CA-210063]|uniref:hypothetical protein n=1 Tax=Streptomyces sp. CA-210063 TaxID=2801029 RepID=UPI00214AB20C|nr:hypothetical protein [Streptomyces sp. CA-210063]UUU31395.1 hypothetical protein JIX56_16615 [Streptomyces sp. CA-210063]
MAPLLSGVGATPTDTDAFPLNPRNAENAEVTSMPSFGRHDIVALLTWVFIHLFRVSCPAVGR